MPDNTRDNLDRVRELLNLAHGARADYLFNRAQTFALLDIAESLRAIRDNNGQNDQNRA